MSNNKREQRKKEIAIQALDFFSTNGFYQASIRDLASALNISKGTLYDYFESKEDIIRYVCKEYLIGIYKSEMERFMAQAQKGEPDPREIISVLLKKSFYEESSDLQKYRLVLHDIGGMAFKKEIPEVAKLFEGLFEEFSQFLTGVIKNAQKRSLIKSTVDPKAIAVFLISAGNGLDTMLYMLEKKYDYNNIVDNFLNLLF